MVVTARKIHTKGAIFSPNEGFVQFQKTNCKATYPSVDKRQKHEQKICVPVCFVVVCFVFFFAFRKRNLCKRPLGCNAAGPGCWCAVFQQEEGSLIFFVQFFIQLNNLKPVIQCRASARECERRKTGPSKI